jgi:hypothetical protein
VWAFSSSSLGNVSCRWSLQNELSENDVLTEEIPFSVSESNDVSCLTLVALRFRQIFSIRKAVCSSYIPLHTWVCLERYSFQFHKVLALRTGLVACLPLAAVRNFFMANCVLLPSGGLK